MYMYFVMFVYLIFSSCDLDLEQMILMYKFDLGILKMYLYYLNTKNEVSEGRFSKITARKRKTHAHRQTQLNVLLTRPTFTGDKYPQSVVHVHFYLYIATAGS